VQCSKSNKLEDCECGLSQEGKCLQVSVWHAMQVLFYGRSADGADLRCLACLFAISGPWDVHHSSPSVLVSQIKGVKY
jgi:hypothetical protein